MADVVDIGGRRVGTGERAFVIAEAGVNHDGKLSQALELVAAAKRAGADAVKFQTFRADRLVTRDAPQAEYQAQGEKRRSTQHEMLRRLELSDDDHLALVRRCRELGVLFLSSPFDERSADLLEELGVPAFKIGSGELTNTPLLQHVARKGRPMLVSTGMADIEEVRIAVDAIRAAGNDDLVLLHCVSLYPAPLEDVNLRAMQTLRSEFGVPVGYSDHTEGNEAAMAAVALGACVLERHFTLDRSLPGPDHRMSIDEEGLSSLVRTIRSVEAALGTGEKIAVDGERAIAAVARKSLVAAVFIEAGTEIGDEMLKVVRPGTGMRPGRRAEVVGKRAARDIPADTPITEEMLG